ncbi:SusC/RagA family TonB-linked outer membrane protein [Flavobacterium sp.]|uniref:SusC/RagA family TonB-linked outer membrane protein n=1 Tax=Flavobacterium sp. TaxID=239 RepID=UPI0025BED4F0|nr:SusC/RagA family TonB-linked outer membrane protein [Flavobacterium sp.]
MRSKFKWIFTLLVAFTMQFSFAQQKTVTGTVISDGVALPGASIKIKGTNQGTTSNDAGKYSIKAKEGDVLVVTFLNKKDQSATVGASNVINFTLASADKEIVEVVVTSLGIKKRQDAITSSNQVVKVKELMQASNPNIVQSLTGKVSGLQINTTANGVNASTKVVLRGNRSISGNNEALVVIDNAISSLNVLNQLPPEMVESINVIKGQQGAALYGENGSNGVIIVTTKKGTSKGKLEVSYNTSIDFQNISFLPKRQTKYGQGWGYGYDFLFPNPSDPRNGQDQFVPYENGAWGPSFSDPNWANTVVPVGLPQADGQFLTTTWNSKGYDNIKDFYTTGVVLQNGITLNAGDENGYATFSYNRQTTDFVVENDALKKNSFMFKAGKKINKLSVDGTVNYISQITSQTDSNLLDDLLQTPTNVDVNQFRNVGHEHHWTVYAKNPWLLSKQNRIDDKSNLFIGNLILNYQLNKNISVTSNTNIRTQSLISESHSDKYNINPYTYNFAPYTDNAFGNTPDYDLLSNGSGLNPGSYYLTNQFTRNIYSDFMFNFDYDLTADINAKVNTGVNIQDRYARVMQQGGTGLDKEGFYHITNVLNPANPSSLSNYEQLRRSYATFANADLSYKDYLFLNLTGRFEKSSVIDKGFFYPSAGVSFVPTKAFESIKGDVLNYLKVSASWTKVGNTSTIAPYATNITGVVASGFPFGDIVGYQFNRSGTSKSVEPEFITNKELGINLGFFKDRVTLDGSFYIQDNKNMITNAISSRATGLTTLLDNTGVLQTKGFEIDLGLVPFKSANGFNWTMRVGYTKYKTVVKKLSEGVTQVPLQQYNGLGIGVFAQEGEEFPLLKGIAFQRDPNGNIIVDANGNPLRTTSYEKLGKVNPDYIINLSNTFSYKGFSLVAVADFRTGHSIWSETYQQMMYPGFVEESADQNRYDGYIVPGSVQFDTATNTYVTNTTPVNTNLGGGYPGVADYFGYQHNRIGETSIVDATALKIRELSLSYSLPAKMLKNTGIKEFKFGVNARNPFVFFLNGGHGLKNNGFTDPEASNSSANSQGISNVGQYPTTRTFGASLNVTF